MSTFLKATDGKINSIKSKVYGWNCPLGTLAKIARTLGFEGIATWNSFNYLGIPIFKGKKRTVDWHGMIDQTKNKINSWGTRWLNPAGKLTLINSILSAYPIYSCLISLATKKL